MPNATITAVSHTGNVWQSRSGPMYVQNVKFSDNVEGEANSKTPVPPYKVGDEVEYTIVGDFQGINKLKIAKANGNAPGQQSFPNMNGGRKGQSGSGYSSHGARVGMAMNCAVQLVCHGKVDLKAIEKVAGRLVEIAEKLEGGLDTKEESKARQHDERAPQGHSGKGKEDTKKQEDSADEGINDAIGDDDPF